MNRILTFIMAATFSVAAFAQTVEPSKAGENISLTLYGGNITTTHTGGQPFFWGGVNNIFNGLRPFAGLELAKYVTPAVGFSIEGLAMFNTTGSNTFVDQSNVVGNVKLNLSNLFGGYKGEPRAVEVVLVPGLGWGHDYGNVYNSRNYLTYNAGVELNVNVGAKKAWQINIKPVVMWNNYHGVSTPKLENMQVRLQVGVTYKFASKAKNSHNFVYSPYTITKEEYDALNEKYGQALAKEPKEVVKTVVETKEVFVRDTRVLAGNNIITFAINSAKITDVELGKIDVFVKSLEPDTLIQITGSADSKTGKENYNHSLAEKRANVVKDILVNKYGISESRITIVTVIDATDNPLTSRSAILTLYVE